MRLVANSMNTNFLPLHKASSAPKMFNKKGIVVKYFAERANKAFAKVLDIKTER